MTDDRGNTVMKLKIDLLPGTKLSETFNNHRDCYKIVELDKVFGYVVLRGGQSTAAIYPLYRADIHVKAGKTWHLVSSYEQGERLNGYTFHDDYEGCTLGTIAAQAIAALEERRHVKQLVKQTEAKKRRQKKRSR